MTDTDLGGELTPDEQSYFESGGQTEIPGGASGQQGDGTTTTPAGEGGGDQQRGDGQPTQQGQAEQPRHVPLAALHEERTRRRDLDRQNRELQQQIAELKGKFSIIDRLTEPAPQRLPTVQEDIFGVVENTASSLQALQQRLDKQDADARKATEERTLRDDTVRAYQIDAAQFEQRTPDFKAAYNHLLQSRAQELIALGYDDPQAMHQALMADEFAVAQMALQSRRSPAEVIYNLAKQRGYKAAAPAAPGGGTAAEKIDAIARGQQAGKTLTAAGGAPVDAEMSAEALLKMPMDEFEAWCNKNPAKAKRLMGG